MIHGLVAAIAVILRFAFLFGIYYLIKGVLLLSGRRLPLRGREGMSKENWEKWAAGEGESMPLLGGNPDPGFCKPLSFKDHSLYPGSGILCAAGVGICEKSKK